MAKKIYEGLDYRQYQRRNSRIFFSLSKREQKKLRAKGYWNVGWDKVRMSWVILQEYLASSPAKFEDCELQKEAERNFPRARMKKLEYLVAVLGMEREGPLADLITLQCCLFLLSEILLRPFL
ncbi:MAG: hypothetical protein NZ901_01055 [Geminocystis sp.]|nr:hypothetical protein [Geminocystis sp.]HIK36498.1 hypothetical protein [Geminocystis sp. M7585_C2015_104]MCS7146756.1 hypothetical protein [Geminocystis sp.]MCX8077094.1 hypothetical protein [Geminocystis sp.]MDW8115582.1 hypothetical protein [Geminocystis sp.]